MTISPSLDLGDAGAAPFGPIGLELLGDLGGIGWRREMTPDGRISYPWFSDATQAILGFAPDAMTVNAKGTLTVIHWADRDQHMAAVRASAASLAPCRDSFRAISADGETRWLSGASRPRRLGDGRVVWDGLWLDNTPRMRAEEQHQMLMDHAEDCIFILTGQDGISWANASAERHFGYAQQDLIGRCFKDLIDPGDLPPCSCDPCLRNETGADHIGHHEVMALYRDGPSFPFEMTVSELRRDGKLHLIVIGRDITRRRMAERLLEESEQQLRITFAAASLGIVVVGENGLIQFYNPAFESMSGEGYDTLLGVSFDAFVPHDLLPPPAHIPPPGMSFCLVCSPTLADGDERRWRLTGTQFKAAPSESDHSLLFFIEDVTETTRISTERHQMETLLHEAQKLEALGRLAGGVAHELNNMLGPILMGAEMVARTSPLDTKNAERVQRIIDAAKNSRDIVRNVLAYCRNESKTLTKVDMAPLFDGFAAMAASVLPPTVTVTRRRALDHAVVLADAGQLQQVLLNLVNNARDAMAGAGTLTLTLERLSASDLASRFATAPGKANPLTGLDLNAPHLGLSVSDTGTGLSPAVAARAFDPFFTTKPVGQGTGLGLSVVQGIVNTMRGAIAVDSPPGRGATFTIILPLVEGD